MKYQFEFTKELWNKSIEELNPLFREWLNKYFELPQGTWKVDTDEYFDEGGNSDYQDIWSIVGNQYVKAVCKSDPSIEITEQWELSMEHSNRKVLLTEAIEKTLDEQKIVPLSDPFLSKEDSFEQEEIFEEINDVEIGFVYFIRNDDIFKIGMTQNLLRRMQQLQPDEILDSIRCSNYLELEKKLHSKFADCRIPQTEYFRLSPSQISEVHKIIRAMAE